MLCNHHKIVCDVGQNDVNLGIFVQKYGTQQGLRKPYHLTPWLCKFLSLSFFHLKKISAPPTLVMQTNKNLRLRFFNQSQVSIFVCAQISVSTVNVAALSRHD